jgi:hypothetical protein
LVTSGTGIILFTDNIKNISIRSFLELPLSSSENWHWSKLKKNDLVPIPIDDEVVKYVVNNPGFLGFPREKWIKWVIPSIPITFNP